MAKKIFVIFMALAVLFSTFGFAQSAQASARTASWTVSVTYQNVGSASTPVTVYFYEEGSSSPISFNPLQGVGDGTLPAGAGASFFIGNVTNVADGFKGNAVMSAQQPLVATVVQFSQDPGFRMRLLSNGFQAADGSTQYLVATVLKNKFSRTTEFSVQNINQSSVQATVNFYDADNNGVLASSKQFNIPASSSKYIEMDNLDDTGIAASVFNGSAIVTVPSGAIVSAASEMYTNRNLAANFEGIPLSRAAPTIYLATALCNKFGLDTYYAVQNASLTTSTNITVTYRNLDGTTKATDGPYAIGPGQKKSITTCNPSDTTNMNDFTGSAVVTSTVTPIAVIGKAQCTDFGTCTSSYVDVFTAFLGEPAGASKLAAPFIRYANDADYFAASNNGGRQRSFIAIQNLESTSITVKVEYYGKSGGSPIATHTLVIAPQSKANSDAKTAGALGQQGMKSGSFGYYTDGTFGGSVLIKADGSNPSAKFIAIVRCNHPGSGEDYNAVAVP